MIQSRWLPVDAPVIPNEGVSPPESWTTMAMIQQIFVKSIWIQPQPLGLPQPKYIACPREKFFEGGLKQPHKIARSIRNRGSFVARHMTIWRRHACFTLTA